jgi:hypothetical protein
MGMKPRARKPKGGGCSAAEATALNFSNAGFPPQMPVILISWLSPERLGEAGRLLEHVAAQHVIETSDGWHELGLT